MVTPVKTDDLAGKTFVITGANTGIGQTAATQLADRGARLVLACRSREKTEPTLLDIRNRGGQAEFVHLDLTTLDSVRSCAADLAKIAPIIDTLILNAGVGGQRGLTADGFELHFGVNHLGHYLLTRLVIDQVAASPNPRIVIVASNSHKKAKALNFDAVKTSTASVTGVPQYEVSKLCNVLFQRELTKRLQSFEAPEKSIRSRQIRTYALNPGRVATDVWRRMPAPIRWAFKKTMISAELGGSYIVKCAAGADFAGDSGQYYSRGERHEPSLLAQRDDLALELWQRSASWCGIAADGVRI